ncbi:MAG: acyl-CoA reductase [Chitinophagaceae bacterium]|nr:acyl-CoA reductase [Chitinophagaceae bacterium]MCB9046874.1 acyl-CoA reductase [Chitinophagales bacterium]
MPLNERIDLLQKLGTYMSSDEEAWLQAKDHATMRNSWFNEDTINMAVHGIVQQFLQKDKLEQWTSQYPQPHRPKKLGIVMAGNIPLVGFHDFLCGFVSGHDLFIKLSSKDDIMLSHLAGKLVEWQPQLAQHITFADNLKGCDAYIATGSNNTARYFEQYFSKWPNIIRKNRTSVAILRGNETPEELEKLGVDIFSYYGLGCRNVTKVYVPEGYDFASLLKGLEGYKDIILHHKYKNNYDYQLAIYLLNKVPYMTNEFLLMVENKEPFSAVSVLHYEYYSNEADLLKTLHSDDNVQCIVDNQHVIYGSAQQPALADYADGVDTMMFLSTL